MNKVSFEDFEFEKTDEGVRTWFYKNYYFDISEEDLQEISNYEVKDKELFFDCNKKKAEKKLSTILNKGKRSLKNRLRNKETIFVDEDLGLPLIGCNEFGLIDRGTNIIEVKPVTGCNLSCIYCSISEGENQKKDLLIDLEYLINEFEDLTKIKKEPVEANIGPQGEPLLYPKIVELIKGLKPFAETISINTNGTLLSEELIDKLARAGLTRINLSLHSLNKETASKLSNANYDTDRIKKLIKYCEGKIDVMLTPLFIPDYNEDLDEVFLFAKTIKNKSSPVIGVQNYLNYKQGRNITKEKDWDSFYEFLEKKEKELKIKLMLGESSFNIIKDNTLPKPFKKGSIIKAKIICPARNKNEYYGSANNRCITIINPKKNSSFVNVKILRDKHNIFLAK